MTEEEYENNISDRAEAEYDRYREEKVIAQYEAEQEKNDTQENFNKVVEVIREVTDKKTDNHGKETLYIAIREFLQTQLNQIQADENISKICEAQK